MLPPWCAADSTSWPTASLPPRGALDGLDAVIEAVAHKVRQRIDDPFDEALVELGRLAERDELDLLAELAREIAHEPRKAAEHVIHRHHPDRHHGFLQIARVALELRHPVVQAVVQRRIERARRLGEHRLRDHELADQVDQLVDLLDADANRAALRARGDGRARLAIVLVLRGGGRRGLRGRRRGGCGRARRGGRRGRARVGDGRRRRLRRGRFRRGLLGSGFGRGFARLPRRRRGLRVARARRGAAADRDLAFVDHEAAHGDDVVRRHVGLEPQRECVARLRAADDPAEIAELLGQQFLILVVDARERDLQMRAIAAGRGLGRAGHRMRGLDRLLDDVLGRAEEAHRGRGRRSRRRRHGLSRRNGRRRRGGSSGSSGRGRGGRRRLRAARRRLQPLELRADRGRGGRIGLGARAVVGELVGQHVLRLEERIDHLLRQRELMIACAIEQRFEDVRRFRERGEAERRGAALDRVRGAKDRRQILGIGRGDVQVQQQLLHLREQLVGFVEERLVELCDIESHAGSPPKNVVFVTKGSTTPKAPRRARSARPGRSAFRSSRSRPPRAPHP